MALFITLSPFSSIKNGVFQKAQGQQGSAYVLIEDSSLRVLEGSNIHARLEMASTTKIMTALLVLKNKDVNEEIIIPKEAVGVEGSSIYLQTGQKWKLIDLLYGLMLRSGNDAAVALAVAVSGNLSAFVDAMNAFALELGLKNTSFRNPHGLHQEGHYTSAYDLALITAEAYKHSLFEAITSAKSYRYTDCEGKEAVFYNKNKLLGYMDTAVGVKTGYTKSAGRCFVGAAKKDNMRLISVCLNRGDMFPLSQGLLEKGLINYKLIDVTAEVLNNGSVSGGVKQHVRLRCEASFLYPIKTDERSLIFEMSGCGNDKVLTGANGGIIIAAPIEKGERVAKLNVYDGDKRLLFSTDLCTMEAVATKAEMTHFAVELERLWERYAN